MLDKRKALFWIFLFCAVFKTVYVQAAGPTLIAPAAGISVYAGTTQEFQWESVSGAASYTIEFSKEQDFASIVTQQSFSSTEASYEKVLIENPKVFTAAELDFFSGFMEYDADLVDDPSASTGQAVHATTLIEWGEIQAPIANAPYLIGECDCYVVARSSNDITLNTGLQDNVTSLTYSGNQFTVNDSVYREYYLGKFTLPPDLDGYFFLDGSESGDESGRDLYVDKFIVRPCYPSTYYWRVVAYDELGNPSYSEIRAYTIEVQPSSVDSPTLIAPAAGISVYAGTTQTFHWQSVLGAASYMIQFSRDSGFTEIIEERELSAAETSYEKSLFETVKEFAAGQLEFFSGFMEYDAELVDDPSASTGQAVHATTPIEWGEIQAPIANAPSLAGEYHCYLAARSSDNLTVSTALYNIDTGASYSGNELTISGNDYKEYYLGKFTFPANMNGYIYIDGSGSEDEPGKELYVDKFILRPGYLHTYYWRVAAYDEFGIPNYSETWSIITKQVSSVDKPILIAPVDGIILSASKTQEFQWQPVPGVTGYIIEFSDNPSFTSIIAQQSIPPTETSYEGALIGTGEGEVTAENFSPWVERELTLVDDPLASTGTAAYIKTPFGWDIQAPIANELSLVGEWDCYLVARSTSGVNIMTGMYDIKAGSIHWGNTVNISSNEYEEYYFGRFRLPSNMNVYFFLDGNNSESDVELHVDRFVLRSRAVPTYYWRVAACDGVGAPNYSEVWRYSTANPLMEAAVGNLLIDPNPFSSQNNERLFIYFSSGEGAIISSHIYNLEGQLVRSLIEEVRYSEGKDQKIEWDGRDNKGILVPSGIYLVVIKSKDIYGKKSSTQRLPVFFIR